MGQGVINLSAENFKKAVLQSDTPVLVDLWAEWCGPCRAYGPVVEKIAARYAGRLNVLKLNVEEYPGIAQDYGVSSIPTTLFFKGGAEVDRATGALSEAVLEEYVKKIL